MVVTSLGELIFIGLGLCNEQDMSLRGIDKANKADYVFAEFYTSLMSDLSLAKLEERIGKKITVVFRKLLEEENGEVILEKAENARVVFMVPGEPLIATTHIDLRIRAHKRGIKTQIVHSASILSAAVSSSGLQNYRFGRNVTVPFSMGDWVSLTPFEVIMENRKRNLHTLCFLDIRDEDRKYMTIKEALDILLENKKTRNISNIRLNTLVVGLARVGAENMVVKADKVEELLKFEFGSPPHVLIVPSERLHFMEAKALMILAEGPEWIKELII